jgi:hypothetical protein
MAPEIGRLIALMFRALARPALPGGRWVAWMLRGVFMHRPITATPQVRSEKAIGWIFHSALGIVYAGLDVAIVRDSLACASKSLASASKRKRAESLCCKGADGLVHCSSPHGKERGPEGSKSQQSCVPSQGLLLGCSGGPNAGRLFCEGRILRPMTRSVQPMTGIPDDETLSLILQRPGDDETARIAETSVGDIRSALKRAREAALAEAAPGEREQVEGLWAIIGVVVSTGLADLCPSEAMVEKIAGQLPPETYH